MKTYQKSNIIEHFKTSKEYILDDVDGVIDLRKAQKVKTKMENLNI